MRTKFEPVKRQTFNDPIDPNNDPKPRTIPVKNQVASAIHPVGYRILYRHFGLASSRRAQCSTEAGQTHTSELPKGNEFRLQVMLNSKLMRSLMGFPPP